MRAWWLAVALFLSGCLGSEAPRDTPEPVASDPSGPFVPPALPCSPDPSGDLSPSFEVLAVEGFADDPSYREELDVADVGGRLLMAVARASEGGFDLLDVTDPRLFVRVATWHGEGDAADDLKFLPGGSGVVVGGHSTLRIVDVRDPGAPELEHTFELGGGGGAHMVATWTLDGVAHVSISKAEGGDVSIFRVAGEPGSRTLERVSHLAATPLGEPPAGRPDPVRSHDTWFEVDPVTGVPTLWVANVYWGVMAYDVSDPATPTVVSAIPNTAPYPGYVHNAQVTHLDGRRLVVATQEYGTGVVKVWDATDLAAPRYVAYSAPGLVTTAFHNLQVVGRYAYATHFDEGLFVFDLGALPSPPTEATAAEMPRFAHVPAAGSRADQVPPRVPVGLVQGNFGTQDVELRDGVVWTSEAGIGVRSLAFGCLAYGDPAATSTG